MSRILITGGCGFIGANAVNYYINKNYKVCSVDNLSRNGSKQNLKWLKKLNGEFIFKKVDIRDYGALIEVFKEFKPDLILHLAAQTTVTKSIENPREDFEINALGTLNILEAMRTTAQQASLIYSSTNKVMGDLQDIEVKEEEIRYSFKKIKGISEKFPLNLCSPYACSKGAGDQYVLDYARMYGLKTVVFRQSCIYGPRQFGMEEQGWLSWFIMALVFDKQITLFGNGKQVRDVLYVDDLIDAYDQAFTHIDNTMGKVYNIGGGQKFNVSLLESFKILEKIAGKNVNFSLDTWRPADQKVYISDVSLAKKDFSWFPKISPENGLKNLYRWVVESESILNTR